MTSLELPKSRELCLALMFIFETFSTFVDLLLSLASKPLARAIFEHTSLSISAPLQTQKR